MTNTNSIYREKVTVEKATPTVQKQSGDGGKVFVDNIEPPFTDYEKVHNHPYLVDHFELGDTWRDKLGGYEKEVVLVEDYFKDKIDKGFIKNDIQSVKEEMKRIYKLGGIKDIERSSMQIEKLSAFIEYQNKLDGVNRNYTKYR